MKSNHVYTYLKDSYESSLNTIVSKVTSNVKEGMDELVLEDTVFYPQGGGQPCDQGVIKASDGQMDVKEVKIQDEEVVHLGNIKGNINKGDEVKCQIDWNRRYHNMQVHSAGHLIDEALFRMGLSPVKLKPVKGSHGKNPYILYSIIDYELENDLAQKIENELNEIRTEGHEITTEFVDVDSISSVSRIVFPNLPSDKPLRVISVGDSSGIPDGGTIIKDTSELKSVEITGIEESKGELKISYEVNIDSDKKLSTASVDVNQKKRVSPSDFPQLIKAENELQNDFKNEKSVENLSELKSKYLGKKGIIRALISEIPNIDQSQRAEFGKAVNELKKLVEKKIAQVKGAQKRSKLGKHLQSQYFDVTADFAPNTPEKEKPQLISRPGTLHPITQMGSKALNIFESMGFHVTYARRLDSDYNVFESLNLPKGHPARDMWDTFWTTDGLIPITHTSAMQNRIYKNKEIPIREVIVGRCARNEATDASHEHTFYQVEGVYVDKGITLADLIGTLSSFMNAFYGKDVKYRVQPSYFPFVEPGLEFMVECLICGQKGCPFCSYSGWVELVPCGPIHPNVLEAGGLDPEEYSGFAWGIGYDRLVILGSQITDIRHIHDGDLKFLEQFK